MSKVVIEFGALEELIRDSEKVRVIDSLIRAGEKLNEKTICAIVGTTLAPAEHNKVEALQKIVSIMNEKQKEG